jgi:hypothetical protein
LKFEKILKKNPIDVRNDVFYHGEKSELNISGCAKMTRLRI